MARAAMAAMRKLADNDSDRGFLNGKIATARFYADHVLPRAGALLEAPLHEGAELLFAIEPEHMTS